MALTTTTTIYIRSKLYKIIFCITLAHDRISPNETCFFFSFNLNCRSCWHLTTTSYAWKYFELVDFDNLGRIVGEFCWNIRRHWNGEELCGRLCWQHKHIMHFLQKYSLFWLFRIPTWYFRYTTWKLAVSDY